MERILEISFKHNLSHIGSCINAYPILNQIYKNKDEMDIVVLSCGHAGLAQYVVIEEQNNTINAEEMLIYMGIHPSRDIDKKIHVSSGSLGSGILVSVGLALANKRRNVHCILSDGECAEGTVWEALSFIHNKHIDNIFIHVIINGFSAYDNVDRLYLENRLKIFLPNIITHQVDNPPYLGDLNAHYYVLQDKSEINKIMNT